MSKLRSTPEEPRIRIGELARRTGVPTATLRAWERRYGVPRPGRGQSGYRLYSPADELRLIEMMNLIEQGLAPAEAAKRVLDQPQPPEPSVELANGESPGAALQAELTATLLRFDDGAAESVLDRALGKLSIDAFVGELVLPVLRDLGERWARDEVTIGQEHFASNLLRGRMLGIARGWGGGEGRMALLACPPGEYHDLGLIGFGVALRARGWRVTFLGADTPVESITACAEELEPDLIVVCSMVEGLFIAVEPDLAGLAVRSPLTLAGSGVTADLAERLGAEILPDDPLEAAGWVAA